jgi:hypothetical protein
MHMLPAEKMLAQLDPGYSFPFVTSLLDTHLNNGTMRFVDHNAETPAGVAYGEAVSDLFFDVPPMREFRKKYKLVKLGGSKYLLQALLKTYKEFRGKNAKAPQIGILEFRAPFQKPETSEYGLLAEFFAREGYATQIISPDQLEYRNGVLRSGEFQIDLVFRRVKVQELLVRFDLSHPLVRAYRDRAVCMVNSFRSELSQKKAVFDLLTDTAITEKFPIAERKAIREFIPWTRLVTPSKTTYGDQQIDLQEFILKNREKLVLKSNDGSPETPVFRGANLDDTGWERALKTALRSPYVVQEEIGSAKATFPIYQYGTLETREMNVEVHPHAFLGKVHGASSWVSPGTQGFSSLAGLAPTFLLEVK